MEERARLPILDELDKFNTAPIDQSGSIMEGILNEQEGLTGSGEVAREAQDETFAEPKTKELPSDYLPLNSSIQDLSKSINDRFTNMERQYRELSTNIQGYQQPRQEQQQVQQPQYDPEAPVTYQHLSQLFQAYSGVNQASVQALKNSTITRAQLEYMRYKQENPDFALDPREIDNTVEQAFKTGRTDVVTNANWRAHFDQMHRPTIDSKLSTTQKELEAARKEIETLKKRPVVKDTAPISPAVGRTTTRPSTIESPVNEPNDDILNLKSFKQKGNFKGFGNDMKRKLGTAK